MRVMQVLVACESSGRVRDAFRDRGHDAWSCDLLPTEVPGQHYMQDVTDVLLARRWDLVIAFPPCDHLAVSGAKHFATKRKDGRQLEAVRFFWQFVGCAPKWCIENPVGIMSTLYRKPDQYIQPWQHGHGETKKTGLWLGGLPLLQPSNVVPGREQRVWRMAPGPNRKRDRSRTYLGIAKAMADQWG